MTKFGMILSTCVLLLVFVYHRQFCNAAYFNVHCYFNDDCSCTQGQMACCMFKRESGRNATFGSCFCCPGTNSNCPANTSTSGGSCGCYKLLIDANLTNANPISCRAGDSPRGITYEEQRSMFVGQSGIFFSPDAD